MVWFSWGISEMKMLYRVGERMLPWGTPAAILYGEEETLSMETEKDRLERKELMKCMKQGGNLRMDIL